MRSILGAMMAWDVLVQQLWLQVTAGLVVAGVLASFNKKFRMNVWVPIWRVLRWPFTLRLTTTRKQRALAAETEKRRRDSELTEVRFKEVCDLLDVRPLSPSSTVVSERIVALRDAKEAAWTQARKEIEANQLLAKQQLAEQVRSGGKLAETARELGRQQGRAEAMAEITAERAAPQLRAQWRVDDVKDSDSFILKNTQPGVHISDLSLFPPMGDFAFNGPSQ